MSTYIPSQLRRLVYQRAEGRCEYCLIPETVAFAVHEIDHILPQKHGGLTEPDNLALACALCNKHKGSDIASLDPETGALIPLFHPRRDSWGLHFRIARARIVSLTPTGRVTAYILQLNHPDRIKERQLLIAAGIFPLPG